MADDTYPADFIYQNLMIQSNIIHAVAKVVGFNGKLTFDTSKPDVSPKKLLDVTRLNGLGWFAKTSLERLAYSDYLEFAKTH